jgi:hypothetical protein
MAIYEVTKENIRIILSYMPISGNADFIAGSMFVSLKYF